MAKPAPDITLVEETEPKPYYKTPNGVSCATNGFWYGRVDGDLRTALADPRALDKLAATLIPGDRVSLASHKADHPNNERLEIAEVLIIRARPAVGNGPSWRPARIAFEPLWYRDLRQPHRNDFDD